MRDADQCQLGYSSYAANQRFEPVRGAMKTHNSPVYRIPDPPRTTRRLTSSTPSCKASTWRFSNPEEKRKQRIASYKAYEVEGKLKASFRNGFRWVKNKCSSMVYGY